MDSLEKFFKDRAAQNEVKFHEPDWDKLESQLDKEMPVAVFSWVWLRKYWLTIPLLLLPALWFAKSEFIIDRSENDLRNKEQSTGIVENKKLLEATSEPFQSKSGISAEYISEDENELNSQANPANIAEEGNEKSKVIHLEKDGINPLKDRGYVVLENGVIPSGGKAEELHFLSSLPPTFQIDGMDMPGLPPSKASLENPTELIEKASKIHEMAFYLGVGYSPDFSTVGIGNFTSPGTRWGILAEVDIFRRWTLQTGIIKVHNKYTANGEDYKAPYRYWQNGIVADETYGTCDMFDIPLNLRYTFLQRGRHHLFVSAGASTYFLTKEVYQFDYDQDDPNLSHEWSTDEMSIYPFGIINFSMGYQYDIGKNGAFQIEPFIKIPTGGIGWGEVDLYTMGAYFIYKYRFGK